VRPSLVVPVPEAERSMNKTADSEPTTILIGHGNTFHDPAVAVIRGDLVYAEALERHLQCKRALTSNGFFYSADILRRALTRLGVLPIEDASVVYRSSWSERDLDSFVREQLETTEGPLQGGALLSRAHFAGLGQRPMHERQLEWVLRGNSVQSLERSDDTLPRTNESGKKLTWTTKLTDHHLAHVGNAVYTSPFTECVVMVSDGAAEGPSLTFHHFADNVISAIPTTISPDMMSLGELYIRITELCGFDWIQGEEWKVMGLAAYGKPDARIREVFERTCAVQDLSVIETERAKAGGGWSTSLAADLGEVLGRFRRPDEDAMLAADLAHNFQEFFSDVVVEVLRNAFKRGLSKNLAMAGGCSLNSSTNGRLIGTTGFERVHVPSAPADDGNALGAALYEKYQVRNEPRTPGVMSPYLGSWIDLPNLERILAFEGIEHWRAPDDAALCAEVAKSLAAGKIIGWVQGRAEFGPRALGNRSILADPRPASMKDEINRRVKFREQFRPVAPSILHEHGAEYFERYQESPYMERTLSFRQEVRAKVPAVVHIDGTGRLQTVKKDHNPLFHQLISAFRELTGIPMLLNTSFNVMGKPIVHSVTDALAVFYTTDLDHLVVESYVLSKRRSA
jgi:carbamoyltransferase